LLKNGVPASVVVFTLRTTRSWYIPTYTESHGWLLVLTRSNVTMVKYSANGKL